MSSPQEPKGVHYRLTNDEWRATSGRLRLAELRVLYHLRTLDPFGDSWFDIQVTAIADALEMHKSTVSRALRQLANQHDIELEIQTARVRLLSCAPRFPTDNQFPVGNQRFLQTTSVSYRQPAFPTGNSPKIEPAQGEGSGEGQCTNNKQNKLVKNNKQLVPTPHPVLSDIDREDFGTDAEDCLDADSTRLLALMQQSGVTPNKTIQQTIASLLEQQGAAAALKAVENAISALQEQQRQGRLRNPGGFLIAALRGSFTANQAKKQQRVRQQPSPPDMVQVSLAIDQALQAGDRAFALAKLQVLWQQGWQEQVEAVCILRKRDWDLVVTAEGVRDTEV